MHILAHKYLAEIRLGRKVGPKWPIKVFEKDLTRNPSNVNPTTGNITTNTLLKYEEVVQILSHRG